MAFWEPFKASDTVTMQAFNDKVGGGSVLLNLR